jgi:hypothetical protein
VAAGMLDAPRSSSSRVLVTGECGGFEPGGGVGCVAGGDLGVDQGAEQFLGCPPLGLRGEQELGGQVAHRGELEPPQPGFQVRCQRGWRGGGHGRPPMA